MDFGAMVRPERVVPSMTPIRGDALKNFREYVFIPIADLKPGDKVKWKSENLKDRLYPELDDVVEVFESFPAKPRGSMEGSNHDIDRYDFSLAFLDEDGDPTIFIYDSRRFERA